MIHFPAFAATYALAAGLVMAAALPANANLLLNPNFTPSVTSTGVNFASNDAIPDWSASAGAGSTTYTGASTSVWDNSYVPGGQGTGGYVGFLDSSSATLSQTINGLAVGDTYQLTYYATAQTSNAHPDGIYAVIAGEYVTGLLSNSTDYVEAQSSYGSAANPFKEYTGTFVATSTSEVLSLVSYNYFYGLNEVVANANLTDLTNPGSNSVPEPASVALLGGGMAAFGLLRRKRNTAV